MRKAVATALAALLGTSLGLGALVANSLRDPSAAQVGDWRASVRDLTWEEDGRLRFTYGLARTGPDDVWMSPLVVTVRCRFSDADGKELGPGVCLTIMLERDRTSPYPCAGARACHVTVPERAEFLAVELPDESGDLVTRPVRLPPGRPAAP